ncbi:MAG: HD domain-containing protein [Ruminococcus sp.]|nr:HD domain-containing protein [Ruminococcus sp.]
MIYTKTIKKAMKIAYNAHDGQFDKSGVPYIYHPIHLAEQMTDEVTIITALLHDVIEDTDYTIDDLRAEGIPEICLEALCLLTHKSHESYTQYIYNLKQNPIARVVKLADLKHNSDITRLNVIDEKAKKRLEKYAEAILFLQENDDLNK